MVAEAQKVLRPHRLEDLHLRDEDPLHFHDAAQQPGRLPRPVRAQMLDGTVDFVKQELEPQLVDLVDDDEQRLIVMRGRRAALLQREQFGHLEVRPVGEGPIGHGRILPNRAFVCVSAIAPP